MSNHFVSLDSIDRRAALRSIALAITATGTLDLEAAQHVHTETGAEKSKTGAYKPKEFTPGEFNLLGRLAELIVPADKVSGSAKDAGAPEFIDTLSSQNESLADIFHGGLAWLDAEMRQRYNTSFIAAKPDQQKAMLDLLVAAERYESERRAEQLVYEKAAVYKEFSAYTVKREHPQAVGARFFDWLRKMTVDAFYTSPIGIKDLGYLGNKALSKYEVPKESLEYALKRSPFAKG
jgi:gluconate 2-dehydrogenase gamma chain